MPMVELTFTEGALADDAKQPLVEQLSRTLLRWEGAPHNAQSAALSWGYVDERPGGTMLVDGAVPAQPRYRVKLTVPQGALDDERKRGLVSDVTRLILDAEGAPDDLENGARVWVIVREVADGNWGGAGQIFRLRDIAALVGAGEGGASEPGRELAGSETA